MPDTASDGGTILNSYDAVIDGFAYTLHTADQDLPVIEGEKLRYADGRFKGNSYVRDQETVAVTIFAIAGIPAPAQLKPFALAIHGYASKFWILTDLKVNSGVTTNRMYSATLKQYVSTPA